MAIHLLACEIAMSFIKVTFRPRAFLLHVLVPRVSHPDCPFRPRVAFAERLVDTFFGRPQSHGDRLGYDESLAIHLFFILQQPPIAYLRRQRVIKHQNAGRVVHPFQTERTRVIVRRVREYARGGEGGDGRPGYEEGVGAVGKTFAGGFN